MSHGVESELMNEAIEYFGSEEAALSWFNLPNITLGGYTPYKYCKTEAGYLRVRDMVNRMKHGMTA